MGNSCIRVISSGRRVGKREDVNHVIEQRRLNEGKKFKVCKDGDGVVRVKVLVTRKELEKLLRHCENRNLVRSGEGVFDAEMRIKSIIDADVGPKLETIPEEY